jgi:hypothetical protein
VSACGEERACSLDSREAVKAGAGVFRGNSFILNTKLRQRFIFILAVYAAVVVALWWVYQGTVFVGIRQSAEETIELAENSLLTELDDEFSRMAVVSSLLSGSGYVQDFLTEKDPSAYYEKANAVSEIIGKTIYPSIDTDSIVTITADGAVTRFTGGISSDAVKKLFAEIGDGAIAPYSVTELDGTGYFCLVSPVYERSLNVTPPIGYVMALSDTAKVRRAMLRLNTVSGIDTAILLDGAILLSSNPGLDGRSAAELETLYDSVTVEPVTGSSLYAATAITNESLYYAERVFVTTSVVSLLALVAVLIALYRVLSSKMVTPMMEKADTMQIGLLQTQISDHFIKNVMNAVISLAESGDTEKIAVIAGSLVSLVRSLHESEEEIHTLQEIEHMEYYIELMNIRSGGKFAVTIEVDDTVSDYMMPTHILQPIAENALTHGMGNKSGDCRLTLTGWTDKDCVIFEISDNGVGMDAGAIKKRQDELDAAGELEHNERKLDSVALMNIQRRIRTRYGKKYGITLRGALGKGLTVTVRLPQIPYIPAEE